MPKWIAFFRGINVGGNNVLSMGQLVSELEALKLTNVRSYIQSGNIVFDSLVKNVEVLAKKITSRIEQQHGFAPQVFILNRNDLDNAIRANPFPDAISDPKSLHFFFLKEPCAKPDREALDRVKAQSESYLITDFVFYLHAPDGVGRSKLAASAEKHLGVATTARNYRTVEKIAAMAAET